MLPIRQGRLELHEGARSQAGRLLALAPPRQLGLGAHLLSITDTYKDCEWTRDFVAGTSSAKSCQYVA